MTDGWANFSDDGQYRYLLGRHISDTPCRLLFIMLNPSTADAKKSDSTITRCINFARDWGYGTMEVVNLFAFRTPYVKALRQTDDPIGTDNDEWICGALHEADAVVLAWGNHGAYKNRSQAVRHMAFDAKPSYHLGLNKTGEPKHPLYLRSDTKPVQYNHAKADRNGEQQGGAFYGTPS